jgi:hypothetical protein
VRKGALWCMAFLMSKAVPAGTLMELGQAPHPAVCLSCDAGCLAKTLHEKPPDAVRWSSRHLAATLRVSRRTVLRIWHAFEL